MTRTEDVAEAAVQVHQGLEGVVASRTRMSRVDGRAGRLTIAGYELEDIAERASFEEMAHLLWTGALPTSDERRQLESRLRSLAALPQETLAILRGGVRRGASPIEALRMGVASLVETGDARQQALAVVARTPSMVAATWRLGEGAEPVPDTGSGGLAARFLEDLRGSAPTSAEARALETYLNTVVDHGFNASTFTARVIMSTHSDLVSAVTGALGALKGPLHGGAPGPVLDTLLEIGSPERAEEVLRAKIERGERLMGFGHRVYEVRDPRAEVLRHAARALLEPGSELLALADSVEATALRLLREAKPGRRIETNVEFYTALLLHALGIPAPLFTSVFAVGRAVGWCAHAFEQLEEGRLIRPRSLYVGPEGRTYAQG